MNVKKPAQSGLCRIWTWTLTRPTLRQFTCRSYLCFSRRESSCRRAAVRIGFAWPGFQRCLPLKHCILLQDQKSPWTHQLAGQNAWMSKDRSGLYKTKKPRFTGLSGHFSDQSRLLWMQFWRRGWDSNPRYLAVRLISSQVHSATLPPLQCGTTDSNSCGRPTSLRGSAP